MPEQLGNEDELLDSPLGKGNEYEALVKAAKRELFEDTEPRRYLGEADEAAERITQAEQRERALVELAIAYAATGEDALATDRANAIEDRARRVEAHAGIAAQTEFELHISRAQAEAAGYEAVDDQIDALAYIGMTVGDQSSFEKAMQAIEPPVNEKSKGKKEPDEEQPDVNFIFKLDRLTRLYEAGYNPALARARELVMEAAKVVKTPSPGEYTQYDRNINDGIDIALTPDLWAMAGLLKIAQYDENPVELADQASAIYRRRPPAYPGDVDRRTGGSNLEMEFSHVFRKIYTRAHQDGKYKVLADSMGPQFNNKYRSERPIDEPLTFDFLHIERHIRPRNAGEVKDSFTGHLLRDQEALSRARSLLETKQTQSAPGPDNIAKIDERMNREHDDIKRDELNLAKVVLLRQLAEQSRETP